MKKIIIFILLILVALWALQNFTGFKAIDRLQKLINSLNQPYLKFLDNFLNWMKGIKTPKISFSASQVTPDPDRVLNIFIRDGKFVPNKNEVLKVAKVTWYNEDSQNHSVSGDNWGSVELKPGETFSKVFEVPGIYQYKCSLHPSETGEIIVR